MNSAKGKKIFVGLSGGVDSAVSAALLQQAGAKVVGVFVKGWYPPNMPCTWAEDRRDAMRAAAHLGIPFHTLDASLEYKQGVIDYLLSEYAAGRTPNPDVMCNREVKFGAFWRFAQQHGADGLAMGHYVRREGVCILRGVDEAKDQSYFLWAVPKEALLHTWFPVGALPKSETRALAHTFGIPLAEKRDSQGICFLGSVSVEDFLRSEIGSSAGTAIDTLGKNIGTHEGALFATIGERIALHDGPAGPWYVVSKDMHTNTLTVGKSPSAPNTTPSIRLRETNWLRTPEPGEVLTAQYRYHGPRISGVLSAEATSFTPSSTLSEEIASGQSLVVYAGEELLGGGIIE